MIFNSMNFLIHLLGVCLFGALFKTCYILIKTKFLFIIESNFQGIGFRHYLECILIRRINAESQNYNPYFKFVISNISSILFKDKT